MLFVCLLLLHATLASGDDWNYGAKGPSSWASKWPSCGGRRQSPISITDLTPKKSGQPIRCSDYNKIPSQMTVTNNGHSAEIRFKGVKPSIASEYLKGKYFLEAIHFHWGAGEEDGSEHVLQKKYFMEVHMVHYSSKYSSVADAMDKDNGLAVVGVFYEIKKDGSNFPQSVIKGIKKITKCGQSASIKPFTIDEIFNSKNDYYYYKGSLTTPPCSETVNWFLLDKINSIGKKEISAFQSLLDSHGRHIVNNFRPPQPLKGRTIERIQS